MAHPKPGSLVFAETCAAPAAPKPSAATVGDAASAEALARLNQAVSELKAQTVLPLLQRSLLAMKADRHREGAEVAIQALEIDERCGLAWHLLAICQEKAGDFTNSLKCYETALELMPEDPEIANDLGRLAYRMGMKDIAEKLFAHYLARRPGNPEGANNLACALRDQLRFWDAIEVLRPAIRANPEMALLWNTLGTVLVEQGDVDQSMVFFDEALGLEPEFSKARYNRANAKLALGDPAGALVDCEEAIPGTVLESEISMMKLARATMLIASGDLERGWDAYDERLEPHYADVTHFLLDRPQWRPEDELAGRSMLLFGEQGLGDEVLFANTIPDVLEALGPGGRLTIAVEHRLVPLFQRSFPTARVGAHATFRVDHHTVRTAPFLHDPEQVDFWAPLGSLLRRFRRSVKAFPNRPSFLKADPERVAHWREVLAQAGDRRKVGLLWKSLKIDSGRSRHFSPFEQWGPVLQTPGLSFVNLQYGDCEAELAQAREEFGVEIWTPPGIDLKADLDDVAALGCAMDLIIGPANATTNIAAACGAPVWLISTPGAWPKLGTERYPWYPQVRVFNPPAFNCWAPAMAEAAAALASLF